MTVEGMVAGDRTDREEWNHRKRRETVTTTETPRSRVNFLTCRGPSSKKWSRMKAELI